MVQYPFAAALRISSNAQNRTDREKRAEPEKGVPPRYWGSGYRALMGVPARARSTFSASEIDRAKQCLYVVEAVARHEGDPGYWGSGYREIVS